MNNSKTFWRIVRSGSTEEFEPAPYVFTLLNALLWLYYGLTKPDGLLVATVNGFGAVMEAIYVVLFIVYAADHAARVRHPTNIYYLSVQACDSSTEAVTSICTNVSTVCSLSLFHCFIF